MDKLSKSVSYIKPSTKILGAKIWKPNLVQRILIKLKIIKDRRYNGNKFNFYLLDEIGSWQTPRYNNDCLNFNKI